ncbi:MAG: hypothetical protein JKY54_14920, partial [Flavobacteriales bacterium]|nr:hypothetical protein [Flavobacteriales bacterium]
MKKLGIMMMVSILTLGAMAQEKEGGEKFKKTSEERAELRVERLSKKLALSDAQVTRIKEVQLERIEERKALQA